MEFKEARLSNGLKILAEVNPAAASMALGFFVRTGSRDETAALAGVSHFLEHMMFKGTDRRSPFDISRDFDDMGAMYNAFTSEENTVYYAAVLPEFQGRALDLLADMMRPALRADDFHTEKQVILEEIALKEDVPQHRLQEKLMAQHFGEHPLGRNVLGTTESISALTRDDMLAYFQHRYSPSNVTLTGVGNLNWDAFAETARQSCSHWQDFQAARDTAEARPAATTASVADAKLTRQHLGMMSRAPSACDEQRYAGHLLAAILGDATGSRLFYALVEPAIADEAACHFEPFDGSGAFCTFICADPSRAAEALRIARREYARFQAEGPTEDELAAAKNKTAAAATLRSELPMGRLLAVGFDWVYRRSYRPLAEQLQRIMAVTAEQVHRLAQNYDLTAATVLGLGPNESL
ncbi:MAG: hypothetical protein AMJ81_07340 [Phycisphaerae bacterium SM23_33]|jgi:predicted Zn-dependent peptidase|nr:MAG: hypothetical protein AMJ81_07340 [Phycisphaerae bacterium SM23_33]